MELNSVLSPITVVCPLAFERAQLMRAWRKESTLIFCCGPGEKNIVRFCRNIPDQNHIILVGLAGALVPNIAAGSAHIIDEVFDPANGELFQPTPLGEGQNNTPRIVRITSTPQPVATAREKHLLAEQTEAVLVDQESIAFARAVSQTSCKWSIVRGVSDDCNETFPQDIGHWISKTGNIRPMRVLRTLISQPRWMFSLHHWQKQSIAAMTQAAKLSQQIVQQAHGND